MGSVIETLGTQLSREELVKLAELEAIVAANIAAGERALEALMEIFRLGLWRGTYGSFAAYFEDKWARSGRQGYRLIRHLLTTERVTHGSQLPAPTERASREIQRAPEDAHVEIWAEAVARNGGQPAPGSLVKQVVDERFPPAANPLSRESQDEGARLFIASRQGGPGGTDEPAADEPVAKGEREILKKASELRQSQIQQKKAARTELHREIAAKNRELNFVDQVFAVIEADCPWEHDNTGVNGAAERHYPTMPTDEICQLPVARHATPNAVLFLWATNAMLEDAEDVMEAWGFEYKTSFVWIKSGDGDDPDAVEELAEVIDERNGTGWYNTQDHELLLVGVRGGGMTPVKRFSSVIVAPRGKHSEKPEKAYQIIEAMYPDAPRLGLFRRSEREGWTPWGNEVDQAEPIEAEVVETPADRQEALIVEAQDAGVDPAAFLAWHAGQLVSDPDNADALEFKRLHDLGFIDERGLPTPGSPVAKSLQIGWPAGVTREEYKAWKAAQEAKGITENLDPQEYKRQRDLGAVESLPARAPAAAAKPTLKVPKDRMTPGAPEELKAPNGKPVTLKPRMVHFSVMGAAEVARYDLETPKGRVIGDLSQDENGDWTTVVSWRRSSKLDSRDEALAWAYARDKYCGGTSPSQAEAADEAAARYGVEREPEPAEGWSVVDRRTGKVVNGYNTKTQARERADRLNEEPAELEVLA